MSNFATGPSQAPMPLPATLCRIGHNSWLPQRSRRTPASMGRKPPNRTPEGDAEYKKKKKGKK